MSLNWYVLRAISGKENKIKSYLEKEINRNNLQKFIPEIMIPHEKVYVLSKEEGGRHTPFFNKYRPQFYMRTTDVTGEIMLPDKVEMVMPGDNLTIEVKLINKVALEQGLRFAIREGGRTVGAGQVTEILD